jgi:hypothetical protein
MYLAEFFFTGFWEAGNWVPGWLLHNWMTVIFSINLEKLRHFNFYFRHKIDTGTSKMLAPYI